MRKSLMLTISTVMILLSISCTTSPNIIDTQNTNKPPTSTPIVQNKTVQEENKIIKDMAGRNVTIPTNIDLVFSIEPVGTVLLYTVCPEKIVGVNYNYNSIELEFVKDEYKNLPVYGMKDGINLEAIIEAKTDIMILCGQIDDKIIETADSMQKQTNISILVIDSSLNKTVEAYEFLGEALNVDTSKHIDFASKVLNNMPKISDDEIATIYFGNGIDSLNTSVKGTSPSEVIDYLNIENVCQLSSESGSRIQVTAEHILQWDPDFIILNGEPKESYAGKSAVKDFISDSNYSSLQAIKSHNIYSIPKAPYAWIDRPSGPNRLIGIKWLASIVYPQYNSCSSDDIKQFYDIFYHLTLTDKQVEQLLNQ